MRFELARGYFLHGTFCPWFLIACPIERMGALPALADPPQNALRQALPIGFRENQAGPKGRLVLEATERFVKSGIDIKDVYGTLGG
jgi:hypothetical protein